MIAPARQTDQDAELMLRTGAGDAEAFVQLYEKHYWPTVRVVSYLMGDQAHSEDLAQLVFVKVYEARIRYVATAKFSTWLYSIVQNVVLNSKRNLGRQQHLQRRMQQREQDTANAREPSQTLDPLAIALRSEVRHHVADLINQLSRNQQRAIQLVYLRGLSYREAAGKMGVSLPSVKLLLYRAKSNLRQIVMLNPDKYTLTRADI